MQNAPDPIIATLTVAFVVVCCVSDVRTREIPNELSGLGVLGGLGVNALLYGTAGVVHSSIGFALPVAVLMMPFVLGGVGGGDVKMMAAVGALVGPDMVLSSLILGMIAGGAVALSQVARLGRLFATFSRLSAMARGAVAERSLRALEVDPDAPDSITLPYSVPMAVGTLASLCLTWAKG